MNFRIEIPRVVLEEGYDFLSQLILWEKQTSTKYKIKKEYDAIQSKLIVSWFMKQVINIMYTI